MVTVAYERAVGLEFEITSNVKAIEDMVKWFG
jgi:hypothetical protein